MVGTRTYLTRSPSKRRLPDETGRPSIHCRASRTDATGSHPTPRRSIMGHIRTERPDLIWSLVARDSEAKIHTAAHWRVPVAEAGSRPERKATCNRSTSKPW
jgi:hypothetical protein